MRYDMMCALYAIVNGVEAGYISPVNPMAVRGGSQARAAVNMIFDQKSAWRRSYNGIAQTYKAPVVPDSTVEEVRELVDESDLTVLGFPRGTVGKPRLATGTSFLPAETVERAEAGSKFEKIKLDKDTTEIFTDIYDYAAKIRAGTMDWEDVEKADIDTRVKWLGLLHRAKRSPGRFMMRLRVLNGIVTSEQMRFYANSVEPFGPELGVIDITTRQNIQVTRPPSRLLAFSDLSPPRLL